MKKITQCFFLFLIITIIYSCSTKPNHLSNEDGIYNVRGRDNRVTFDVRINNINQYNSIQVELWTDDYVVDTVNFDYKSKVVTFKFDSLEDLKIYTRCLSRKLS